MDDQELPSDTASKADEHVPCGNLENPSMVLDISVARHKLFNGRIRLLHLLFNRIEVVADQSESPEWNDLEEGLDPVFDARMRGLCLVVDSMICLRRGLFKRKDTCEMINRPDRETKDLGLLGIF